MTRRTVEAEGHGVVVEDVVVDREAVVQEQVSGRGGGVETGRLVGNTGEDSHAR